MQLEEAKRLWVWKLKKIGIILLNILIVAVVVGVIFSMIKISGVAVDSFEYNASVDGIYGIIAMLFVVFGSIYCGIMGMFAINK